MQPNQFGTTLYRSKDAMLDGIAYEYWTGCGSWDFETVTGLISDLGSDGSMGANDAIIHWSLDASDDTETKSHMELNGYSRDDLAVAMQRFIDTRPDANLERETQ